MLSAQASKVALITGGAQRLGAALGQALHANGWRVLIHYHQSEAAAQCLADKFNAARADSAAILPGDFTKIKNLQQFINEAVGIWGRCDALLNNASIFRTTPFGEPNETDWDALFSVNLKTPYYLAQYAKNALAARGGVVINIGDAILTRKWQRHPIYSLSKQALMNMTTELARLYAPDVRVHAVCPGRVLPLKIEDVEHCTAEQALLAESASVNDVCQTILFLLCAKQLTGQVINVDAGMGLAS